ncbi:MAG TPA: hypothetical protein VIA63_07365 [Candidatus Limnocylindria bacterium]|jgi:hypothetical protein
MVSNVLEVDEEDLLQRLRSFKRKYADDPEYQKLRAALPKEWPI